MKDPVPYPDRFPYAGDPSLSVATRRSLASLYLEGIILPEELMQDVRLLDAGKITHEEFKSRAIARAMSTDKT